MPDTEASPKMQLGSTPIPDPTVLTTQQLLREIATSREVVEKVMNGIRETLETRIEAMDKTIVQLQKEQKEIPAGVAATYAQLRELHEEKFRSIETQFRERDTRTEKTSADAKTAVDAALQAAKEAVGAQDRSNTLAFAKSEAAFAKQIEQQGTLLVAMQKSNDEKIDDVKSRQNTLENRLNSIEGQKKGGGDTWGYIIAAITLAIGIVVAAATVALVFHK